MKHERAAYAALSGDVEDRNDCAVRAYALAFRLDYRAAQRELLRAGRWRHTPTAIVDFERALFRRGVSARWEPLGKPPPLRRFSERPGTWIVFLPNHLAVVSETIVHDWQPRPGAPVELAWRIR